MKPRVNSDGERELQKVEQQIQSFENCAKTASKQENIPMEDKEPIHKISQEEVEKMGDIYLKPIRRIAPGADSKTGFKETFNEKFRSEYEHAKEYVRFIPEHREIIGEVIECWTKKFPGTYCEFWKIPTGRPVWGPRYLKEQLQDCKYVRYMMDQRVTTGGDGMGQYYGGMIAEKIIQRLDAIEVSNRKNFAMGCNDFAYDGRKSA